MQNNKVWIGIFLLPTFLLFCFIYLIPLVLLFATSFCEWTIGSDIIFSGLENFKQLFFHDDSLKIVLSNTAVWILLQSTIHIAIGVALGLILSRKRWYTDIVRTIYIIPNIISSAAIGILFLCILNPQFGMVNNIIRRFRPDFMHNWFNNPSTSFYTMTSTWLFYAAIVTILVMAELTAIPKDLYEAATIDGASRIQIARFIELPLLKNIIGTTTILAATSMLQKLDIIIMTTKGGPGVSTMNMPMYIYKTALVDNNYGLSNALGVLLILMGLAIVWLINLIYGMNKK
ncbi:MAG: sugar ABC transporter permease [Spirochaetales bacterium]|nr:sugar ABC transporter permease [Spirochaetales bacterium]